MLTQRLLFPRIPTHRCVSGRVAAVPCTSHAGDTEVAVEWAEWHTAAAGQVNVLLVSVGGRNTTTQRHSDRQTLGQVHTCKLFHKANIVLPWLSSH